MEERKNKISLATFILVLIVIIMMILGCIVYRMYNKGKEYVDENTRKLVTKCKRSKRNE